MSEFPVCIVCADYAQIPGLPHLWQQCPRLAVPKPPSAVCLCGDTAGAHQDDGNGGCWACACSRFTLRTPDSPPGLNYGFRYTGD